MFDPREVPHGFVPTRRAFLSGFASLALGAMLFRDGVGRAETGNPLPDGKPHFTPRARSVIWIFLCGGVSHVESFDPKPELNKYAGKTIENTPYKDVLNPDRLKDVIAGNPAHGGRKVLMALGCLLALAALVLQVAREERDTLLAREPALRPALQALCDWTGCELSALRQTGSITVDGEEVEFSEGFTDFYARKLSLRSGLFSLQDFLADWNRMLAAYAATKGAVDTL